MRVHIIGGGNLGIAMAKGIVKKCPEIHVSVSRRNTQHIQHLELLGVSITSDNNKIIPQADLVILSVKPFQVTAVLAEIKENLKDKLIASAVTGFSLSELREATESSSSLVRIMPNIAVEFGESATCIAHQGENALGVTIVQDLFQRLGTALVIEEKLMDAATVLGACGTAYALRYIRASMQAGIEIGFDAATAMAIASQTVKGAAKLALEENTHPEQLIDRVTTPQGCTIVGLNEMEHQGFSSALIRGIKTSLDKIK